MEVIKHERFVNSIELRCDRYFIKKVLKLDYDKIEKTFAKYTLWTILEFN